MEPTIYLFFKGDCLEAMTHYAEVLGGTVNGVFRNADAPNPESRMSGGDNIVMNMSVTLGGAKIMASDTPEGVYDRPQGFRVSISAPSREEFDRIHAALAQGARSVEMEPGETFWTERFAMFTHRYGTPWMLNLEGNRAQG